MKIDKYTYWKLNDIEDYDNFIAQASKEGCRWAAGQALEDALMRSGVIHLGFPVIMEIDNDEKAVSITSIHKEKQANDFKKNHKPIVPLKDEIVAAPDVADITVLSFKDSNGNTLNFTEEEVRDNLEDILKTIHERFTSFKVGDRVRVVNPGHAYSTYSDWFEENQIAVSIAARYAYNQEVKENTVGTVKFIGKHKMDKDKTLYLIEVDQNWIGKPFYLVEASGLKMEKK